MDEFVDGGWIKASFEPWQRSLCPYNAKEKRPLLSGKVNLFLKISFIWVCGKLTSPGLFPFMTLTIKKEVKSFSGKKV